MFRNVTAFRFPAAAVRHLVADLQGEPDAAPDVLPVLFEQALSFCALKPVGTLELSSRGFVSPLGQGNRNLVQSNGDQWAFTVGGEDKILPAAAVNAALATRLAEIEQRDGRRPGGRMRKQIRDNLVAEMLPRALVKPSRTDAILDLARGVVFVDTAARRRAEGVVSEVRHALGSFPALPLNAEVAPRSVLTGWLAGDPLPEGLALGESAILRNPADGGARVRLDGQELLSDEVQQHLQSGKQCTRLSLVHECGVAFDLDESLGLRRVRFLDAAMDALESQERDDLDAELYARFVLQAGLLGRVFDVIEAALQVSKGES